MHEIYYAILFYAECLASIHPDRAYDAYFFAASLALAVVLVLGSSAV
jgi:hypothetical protein